MAFDRIYSVDGMGDDEVRTLNRLLEQLDAKSERNVMRASIYDGKNAVRQVGSIIPQQYYQLGLVLGWVAKGVDALARRCTLERFTWADGDLGSLGAQQLWDQNFLKTEVNSAITSCLIHGPAFLVNVQGEEHEPKSLILARDAVNSTGTWNVRKRGLDDFVSVTARKEDLPTEVVLYLDGVTITASKGENGRWTAVRSDHPWGVPVEVLVYRPRLGREFGSSRMTRPAIASQRAGVRDLLRLEGHMDIYSFPDFLILGAGADVFEDADGNTVTSWLRMMGRIKGIPDDEDAENPRAAVHDIPAASPEPHLAAVNTHAKICAREMSLPDNALALTDFANPTSAEAYDAAQYELISEAEGATDDWSTPLRRSYMRGLAIQNGYETIPDEWLSINSKWRNPQFLTRAAEADAGAKQLGTTPWLAETEVGLELLGLSDDQIRRALAERRRAERRQALTALASAAEQARQNGAVAELSSRRGNAG